MQHRAGMYTLRSIYLIVLLFSGEDLSLALPEGVTISHPYGYAVNIVAAFNVICYAKCVRAFTTTDREDVVNLPREDIEDD